MTRPRPTPSRISGEALPRVRAPRLQMIFVREATAAQILDMKPAEFRTLVEAGALPPPREIGSGVQRWYVPDLDAIANGGTLEEEFEV